MKTSVTVSDGVPYDVDLVDDEISKHSKRKIPSKGKQYLQLNQDCASVPSLVQSLKSINKHEEMCKCCYMDVDSVHHQQTVKIENIQKTLYSLGIKSPFILNLNKVEF